MNARLLDFKLSMSSIPFSFFSHSPFISCEAIDSHRHINSLQQPVHQARHAQCQKHKKDTAPSPPLPTCRFCVNELGKELHLQRHMPAEPVQSSPFFPHRNENRTQQQCCRRPRGARTHKHPSKEPQPQTLGSFGPSTEYTGLLKERQHRNGYEHTLCDIVPQQRSQGVQAFGHRSMDTWASVRAVRGGLAGWQVCLETWA